MHLTCFRVGAAVTKRISPVKKKRRRSCWGPMRGVRALETPGNGQMPQWWRLKAPESEFRSEMTSARPQPQPLNSGQRDAVSLVMGTWTFCFLWDLLGMDCWGAFKDRGDRRRLHAQADPWMSWSRGDSSSRSRSSQMPSRKPLGGPTSPRWKGVHTISI